MVKLTDEERRMFDGGKGRLRQRAIENIVRYAEVLGAESLCTVTKATVFCGRHSYLDVCGSDGFDAVFSKVQLGSDEIIPFDSISPVCSTQSCVAPCDLTSWAPLSQSEEFFRLNQDYLRRANEAGVTIAGTCSPYLNGWIPLPGEHFVTTESGMTMLGNSLWGACCNSDGIEAAFWSAICGRTPRWGKHVREGRRGNVAVHVSATPNSRMDWDVLGKTVGDRLPSGAVPVISGNFVHVSFNNIRQFFTALAVSSNCEMCHIPGITYDARTREEAFDGISPEVSFSVGFPEMLETYEKICSPGEGPVGLVSLGCPHYDIYQIKRAAELVKGRHVEKDVTLQVWTTYSILEMARVNGYLSTIRDAGGEIYTSTCPTTIGRPFLERFPGLVFDSLKQSGSVRSSVSSPNYLADVEGCVDAAMSGRWIKEYRWRIR
ncbi:MAG: aconitase X catalytic domain-containing protein [Synergistaceae bacterium]|jgi:predicted aconitase|nr:aconitase X catalytic domain-containing protein [Synergistaceae bacterium]